MKTNLRPVTPEFDNSGADLLRSGRMLLSVARALAFLALLSAAVGLLTWVSPHTDAPAAQQRVKEFTLIAEEVDWDLQDGATVKAWTYNGQMPGPEIRVTEGDLVRVTVINKLPTGTTVHWHGVDVPAAMDGPAGLNQAPIEPGESFVYEFIAKPQGTRWYHSHTDVSTQVLLGLYGPFIVEPQEPAVEYDRDYTYMLAEWDMELTPDVALGLAPRGPRDSELRGGEFGTDLFLFNGKMHEAIDPMIVKEGDRVLVRLINAGNLAHPFHIHGHSFKIVATDGNPVPPAAQITKDTVLIAPGERYDLEFVANNPGVWMVHCHIENHADNGMMTVIQYEGQVPTGPLAEGWDPATGGQQVPSKDPLMDAGASHLSHNVSPATPEADVVEVTPVQTSSQQPAPEGEVLSGDVTVVMVDNRFVPRNLTITAGSTVTFVNKGANWHSVAGDGGLIDSGQVASGASFTVTFDTPGTYKIICKHHLRQGMSGQIVVVDA